MLHVQPGAPADFAQRILVFDTEARVMGIRDAPWSGFEYPNADHAEEMRLHYSASRVKTNVHQEKEYDVLRFGLAQSLYMFAYHG